MSNDFYNASGNPSARSNLSSQNMRVEFASVATGFGKLPALTGNGGRIAKIKNDATAMEASSVLFDDGSSVTVGASATRSIGGVTQRFYVESTDAAGRQGAGNVHNSTTAGGEGASLALGRSRGSALSAVTAVAANDGLGQIKVFGADGASLTKAATIEVYADGAVSTGVVPGRISFKAADASGVLTETARATGSEFRFSKAKALDGTSAIQFHVEPTLTTGDPLYKSFKDDLASAAAGKGSALMGYLPAGTGAIGTTVQGKLRELSISVTDFGAVGDGVTNDTAAILLAKAYAIANLPCRIVFPKGTYKIDSSTGNWAYKGLTLEGVGSRESVLKFTYAGQAFLVDAFQPGFTANDATAPFVYRMNMRNLVFEGNSGTTDIVFGRGFAQSMWTDLLAREANTTTGIGFNLQGVMLNTFTQVSCTINQDSMSNVPNNGLRIGAGTRNGTSVGNSTNNTFINCYAEGNAIGWWLTGSDQNTFISGAPEACTQYGCLIAGISKMNTFIGVGFENPSASTAGCADGGLSNKFINCYNSTKHDCQGDKGEISGGYYELINVNGAGAAFNYIHDCVINHWATGSGGFTDTGTGTQWARIYDDDTAAEIYPFKTRSSITVTASPFQYANATGRVVEIVMQTGTISQVRKIRGADSWLQPTAIPGNHLLLPGDTLEVSYTVAPGMSLVQHNSAS